MRRRWVIALASAASMAALPIALAFGQAEPAPEASTAAPSLSSMVASLNERGKAPRIPGAGSFRGTQRGRLAPVPDGHRGFGPDGCAALAGRGPDAIGCEKLPKDGCAVLAVRVPGEIDCRELSRRVCSRLVGGRVRGMPRCRPLPGEQARPLRPARSPRAVGAP